MGKIRTAAAKKYIENTASSDDESLSKMKRTSRANKRSSLNKSEQSQRDSDGRANRSTKNSLAIDNKQKGQNEKNGRNGKNYSNPNSSDSDAEAEVPISIVNRKRKSLNDTTRLKKQNPSTSVTPSKNKSSEKKSKNPDPKSMKKNKKKKDEDRYEVEEILDHKFENNVKYFLIKWKGYDSSVDSWEKHYNISCPALLAKYYEEHPEARVSAKLSNRKKKVATKPRTLKIDQQLDYDSEWDENEDYEVERILDVYVHRDNKRDFLIRWKGYSSKSDSWEPEDNLDCTELIEKFMNKVDELKKVSQKELRPVRSQTQRFTLMTQASARRLSKRNKGQQRTVYYDCDE